MYFGIRDSTRPGINGTQSDPFIKTLENRLGITLLGELGKGGMYDVREVKYPGILENESLAMRFPKGFVKDADLNRVQSPLWKYDLHVGVWVRGGSVCIPYQFREEEINGDIHPISFLEMVSNPTIDFEMILGKVGKLDPRVALDYISQVADVMCHVRDLDAAHRDGKPGNLLLNKFGEIKVIDFSISASIDHKDPGYALQSTPAYIDPWYNDTQESMYIDAFTILLVLYEFIEGRRPFNHNSLSIWDTMYDQVNKCKRGEYNLPKIHKERDRKIVEALHPIFRRGFKYYPNDRHPSIYALRDELKGVRDKYVKPELTEVRALQQDLATKMFEAA